MYIVGHVHFCSGLLNHNRIGCDVVVNDLCLNKNGGVKLRRKNTLLASSRVDVVHLILSDYMSEIKSFKKYVTQKDY